QRARVLHRFLAKRQHPRIAACVCLRIISCDSRGNGLQFAAHLRDCDATLHLGENVEVKIAAWTFGFRSLERHPQIGGLRKPPAFWHYADDFDALAIDRNEAADHRTISAEMVLPDFVSEQRHGWRVLLIFLCTKYPTQNRLHS